MSHIRLSPKHGVNPSLSVCFWCGKDKGEIVLPGRLGQNDHQAPHRAVWNMEPCDECQAGMAQGITIIEAVPQWEAQPKPTGRWVVLKEEAVQRIFEGDAAESLMKARKGYLRPEAFEHLFGGEFGGEGDAKTEG